MKIKKATLWKHKPKFLKIKLLKAQIYKNAENFKHLQIENIEYRLKKMLHIIYQFHINNKTILFFGASKNLYKQMIQLMSETKHIIIPEDIWLNGAITNHHTIVKYLLKLRKNEKNQARILFQLKKRADLIVILKEQKGETILNEGYVSKIPIISLNSNLNTLNSKAICRIPGNFSFSSKRINNSFLYSILKAILKKGRVNSNKKPNTHRSNTLIKQKLNKMPVNFESQKFIKKK